eukprot:m.939956 g.939956  ORF g.939956 m.939956 type:complete len:66 (-) comp23824_c0_seq40:1503-1700(-)
MVGLHLLDIPKARAQCRAFAARQVVAGDTPQPLTMPLTHPIGSLTDDPTDEPPPTQDESTNETDA